MALQLAASAGQSATRATAGRRGLSSDALGSVLFLVVWSTKRGYLPSLCLRVTF
jgi:hypothetical protein